MIIKRPLSVDRPSFRYGIQIAAAVAADYDGYSTHSHLVSECILAKLNVLKRRPKKNRNYEEMDKVLLRLERKLESLEGTMRFMARASRKTASEKRT